MAKIPRALRNFKSIYQIFPVAGHVVKERAVICAGHVVHNGKNPAVGLGGLFTIKQNLIGKVFPTDMLWAEPLYPDAVDVVFLHPAEMPHLGSEPVCRINLYNRSAAVMHLRCEELAVRIFGKVGKYVGVEIRLGGRLAVEPVKPSAAGPVARAFEPPLISAHELSDKSRCINGVLGTCRLDEDK